MKQQQEGFLLAAGMGMEISLIYAWATFMMQPILHRPFPLLETISTFGLAMVATFWLRGKDWRVFQILAVHLLGSVLMTLRLVYVLRFSTSPFWNRSWIRALFSEPKILQEGVVLFLIVFWALVLWIGGFTFARRLRSYRAICDRFDSGAGLMFLLLFAKLILVYRADIRIPVATEALFLPFLLFGLLAMGFARNQSKEQKTFLAGYRGPGLFLSFSCLLLLFGVGIAVLCEPYLRQGAETGYELLKHGSAPLVPVLERILRFLFMPRHCRATSSSFANQDAYPLGGPNSEMSWWEELLANIATWGLTAVWSILVLLAVGIALYYSIRWLLSKPLGGRPNEPSWKLAAFLRALWHLVWGEIIRRVPRRKNVRRLYALLLEWGRRSGLPRKYDETPGEYGARLQQRFPDVKDDITTIIDFFQQDVYGGVRIQAHQLTHAQQAWHRLHSPAYWPSRLKSWLHQAES